MRMAYETDEEYLSRLQDERSRMSEKDRQMIDAQELKREEARCRDGGKEGRVARYVIREALQGYDARGRFQGHALTLLDAIEHIEGCRRCQHSIDTRLSRADDSPNNTTAYVGSSYEDTLAEVRAIGERHLTSRPMTSYTYTYPWRR